MCFELSMEQWRGVVELGTNWFGDTYTLLAEYDRDGSTAIMVQTESAEPWVTNVYSEDGLDYTEFPPRAVAALDHIRAMEGRGYKRIEPRALRGQSIKVIVMDEAAEIPMTSVGNGYVIRA
jgi:hypothetical protein